MIAWKKSQKNDVVSICLDKMLVFIVIFSKFLRKSIYTILPMSTSI